MAYAEKNRGGDKGLEKKKKKNPLTHNIHREKGGALNQSNTPKKTN